MPTVLISGGSGLVGKHLGKKLTEKGFKVSILSTDKDKVNDNTVFFWNPDKNEITKKAIDEADYIIHLAGANIGDKRWSKKRKQLIIDSRVKSTQLIFDTVKTSGKKIKAFISASAVGYYGAITSDKIFTETDLPAADFLGEVCKLWEQAAEQFTGLGIRTVKIRTAVVLSKKGGALSKMITSVKFGIGSALGNGKQYLPWIHIDDLCEIYCKAIEDAEMKGAYNAAAPDHKTNKEFLSSLAHALNKPFWFPNIPAFILKLLYGKMADMLLKGSRVSCDKITESGFKFRFPDLDGAFKNLFS